MMAGSTRALSALLLLLCGPRVAVAWPESLTSLGITQEGVKDALLNQGIEFTLDDVSMPNSSLVGATLPYNQPDVYELYDSYLTAATAEVPRRLAKLETTGAQEDDRNLRSKKRKRKGKDPKAKSKGERKGKDPKSKGKGKGEDPKAKQIVFVDFNNIVGGVYPVLFFDLSGDNIMGGGCFEAHAYSDVEQEAILEKMTLDFAEFSVAFTVKKPEEGDYATIKFNTNVVEPDECTRPGELALEIRIDCENFDPCFISPMRLGFGRAQGIDFRNKVLNDLSIVDVSFWKFLNRVDPGGGLLQSFSGLSLDNGADEALSVAIIESSAGVGAHELGHSMGLRHHDSLGAPGDGLPANGLPSRISFLPSYRGPADATETLLHLMATFSVGQTLRGVVVDNFFSERSAIKLVYAESDSNVLTAQQFRSLTTFYYPLGLELPALKVPNTILDGENERSESKYGELLDVSSLSIAGTRTNSDELDLYRFFLSAGDIVTIEFIQNTFFRPFFDSVLYLYREEEDYTMVLETFNDDPFEAAWSLILDYEVPVTATYVVRIDTVGADFDFAPSTSAYDLLVYSVEGPASSGDGKGKGSRRRNLRKTNSLKGSRGQFDE